MGEIIISISTRELKTFAFLHIVSQHMNEKIVQKIFATIQCADGEKSGAWSVELKKFADNLFSEKQYQDALQYYNLARFPYINSASRKMAHQQCVNSFLLLNQTNQWKVKRKCIIHEGQQVFFYFKKAISQHAPLLIIMGGIVSIKEQWISIVALAEQLTLDINIVLMEMPGVGENLCCYHPMSYRLLSSVIHSLSSLANIHETHIIAMSFGGHMAIQCALHDKNIQSIFTVGAPLHYFFTDTLWWQSVPGITKKTLAHMMHIHDNAFSDIQEFCITAEQLASIDIPIYYISSQHDEIIPPAEKKFLEKYLSSLHFYEFNDVHGSPHHMKEIQSILIAYLLQKRENIG